MGWLLSLDFDLTQAENRHQLQKQISIDAEVVCARMGMLAFWQCVINSAKNAWSLARRGFRSRAFVVDFPQR